MAKIDDYWIFLPKPEKVIYTELQILTKNKPDNRLISPETKKKISDFLCRCLQTVPVATCKILQLLPSPIADEIYHSVLLDLLNDINADKCNQFLAILLNGQFSSELIACFESDTFPKLVNVLATNEDIDQHFRLCLAFVEDDKFRDRFLLTDDRLCDAASVVVVDDLISRRRLFVSAVVERKHFIEKCIQWDDNTRSMLSNDVFRRTLFLMQMLRNADLPMDKRLVQEINQFSINSTANFLRRNLFNELQRLLNLKELFSRHIPNIKLTSYATKFNLIDILYEHVDLSTVDSQLVLSMLEENRKYNQQFEFCCNGMANQFTEWELYNQFSIVKLLLDVVMENQQVYCIE